MKKQLTNIELSSTVIVSDPCYERSGSWMGKLENVKPGTYTPTIKYGEDNRVKELHILIADKKRGAKWEKTDFAVGVDSGQAGIFCDSIYPENETGEYDEKGSFYHKCCEATLGDGYNKFGEWHRTKMDLENERTGNFIRKYYKEQYNNYQSRFEDYLNEERQKTSEYYQKEGERFFGKDFNLNEKVEEHIQNEIKGREGYIKYYKGILDIIEYYDNHNQTMPPEPVWDKGDVVFGKGVVSVSGYGDGVYPCFVCKDEKDQIIGIKIQFM